MLLRVQALSGAAGGITRSEALDTFSSRLAAQLRERVHDPNLDDEERVASAGLREVLGKVKLDALLETGIQLQDEMLQEQCAVAAGGDVDTVMVFLSTLEVCSSVQFAPATSNRSVFLCFWF